MIAVKATTAASAADALHDYNVLIVLRAFNDQGGKVFVMTMSDDVADRVARANQTWRHEKGTNHAFETRKTDLDTVAVMLAGTLPQIERWETW